MNNQYEYVERPLTLNIARKLIHELFAGQTVQRQDILRTVLDTHLERGGLVPRATSNNPVTLALASMRREGQTEDRGEGIFFIFSNLQSDESLDSENIDAAEVNLRPEKTIGSGKGSVYLYYFPTYKRLAELESETVWPCKIGKARHDAINRIRSQTRTALPEYPKIGLIIKTNELNLMETTIQNILRLQGKQKRDAPGTEWFVTSPSEVEQIYENNFGNLQ